jgi:hypothetical protein
MVLLLKPRLDLVEVKTGDPGAGPPTRAALFDPSIDLMDRHSVYLRDLADRVEPRKPLMSTAFLDLHAPQLTALR